MKEVRKTEIIDSASVTSDSGVDDVMPPMPRPDVNINPNLVKAGVAAGVANTSFNSGEKKAEPKPAQKATTPFFIGRSHFCTTNLRIYSNFLVRKLILTL